MIYDIRRERDIIHILEEENEGSEKFEILDEEVNQIILQKMKIGKVILDLSNNSIRIADEKYYDIPITDTYRVKIIKDAKRKLESLVKENDMIDYINYIDLNNELAERGIFITNSNREEKYLEILETGNEHNIDLLEDYLNLRDDLSRVKSAKNDFLKILEKVKDTKEADIDKLKSIEKEI